MAPKREETDSRNDRSTVDDAALRPRYPLKKCRYSRDGDLATGGTIPCGRHGSLITPCASLAGPSAKLS